MIIEPVFPRRCALLSNLCHLRLVFVRLPLIAALVLIGLSASSVSAHGPERKGARTILRLQGYRTAPVGTAHVVQEMVLVARGIEHRFWVVDRQRFELEAPGITPPRERDRLTLQADFDVLARFTKARDDQLVTILGEQRPGSGDLFILALDLCPP
jgi:hypothetical protein